MLALALLLGCAGPPSDDDDSAPPGIDECGPVSFRGDPARTGRAGGPITRGEPQVQWAVNVLGEELGEGMTWWGGFEQGDAWVDELAPQDEQVFLGASPLRCGDHLVTAWRTGLVTARDPEDGVERWRYELPAPGGEVDGTPVVTSSRTIFGATDGRVRALATATGELVWQQLLPRDTLASPVLVDGRLVLGDKSGRVSSLEAADGGEAWRHERGVTVSSSPSYSGDGGRLLLGEIGRVETTLVSAMFALDAATGDELWSVDAQAQVLSTAAWFGEAWFVGSWDNTLYALAEDDGEVLWSHEAQANISASPAVDGQRVYVGAWDWTLYALDRSTGDVAWTVPLGSDPLASPVIDDETLLQATEDGRLLAVDLATGDLLWEVELTGARVAATPTVAPDGTVYVAAVNGDLVALR